MIKGLIGGLLLTVATAASANTFFDNTYLLEIKQGGYLSERGDTMRDGSYESAYGNRVSFDKWYKPKVADMHIAFLTKVDSKLGIIWGFSTGEKAEKYVISPSVKLGAVFVQPVTKTSVLSIRAHYTWGGEMKEKSCTADYGDVGGVQEVNCRLAATYMQPAETLKYLVNERPRDYKQIYIQYTWNF